MSNRSFSLRDAARIARILAVVVPISGAISTFSYYNNSGFRKFVDLYVFDNSAWFYVGEFLPKEQRWKGYLTGKSIRNFDFKNWLDEKKIGKDALESALERIVRHRENRVTNGRNAAKNAPAKTVFSDYQIVISASGEECFYVNRLIIKPDKKRPKTNSLVWMHATEMYCE